LAVLSEPLVASLFHYGKFSVTDVRMTEQAVTAYSVGLLGLILVKVLAPGFYARQNIKTPVKIAIFTLLLTQAMNLIFVVGLDYRHWGLALATGLGACVNSALLYYHLRRDAIYQPQSGWFVFMVRLSVALIVMALLLYVAKGGSNQWLQYTLIQRLVHLVALVGLGGTSYFCMLYLLGLRPRDFSRRAEQ
jgi:putative peptidoglycan lipid II flippase